jgi:hypothetical protein
MLTMQKRSAKIFDGLIVAVSIVGGISSAIFQDYVPSGSAK